MNTKSINLSIEESQKKLMQAKAINLLLLSDLNSDAPVSERYVVAALMAIFDLIDDGSNQLNQGAADE